MLAFTRRAGQILDVGHVSITLDNVQLINYSYPVCHLSVHNRTTGCSFGVAGTNGLKLDFPEMGATVSVCRLGAEGNRLRMHIDAPREIVVRRGEA